MSATSRPVALVTGASSGIGADLARELARDGYDLILAARRVEPMQALATELKTFGATATVLASDLSKPGAAQVLAREIESRGLVLDALVNNAGLGDNAKFHQEEAGRIAEMLQVNVVALTELTRLLLPAMVARKRGRVMLVGSTGSFQPGPNMAVYCATKAYVLSLGEAIAHELKGSGVTVTVLCPGATETEFSKVANTETIALHKSSMTQRMTSAAVARQGYRAFKAGQRLIITGWMNRVMAFSVRLSPRPVVTALAGAMMERH